MNLVKNENILKAIREYSDDNHCLELLRFFGKYPNARFNRLAIIHGLFNGDAHGIAHIIEKALKRIVDGNLVRTSSNNGITLYSLTEDKVLRDIICEFALLDLPQRQLLLKNTDIRPAPKSRARSVSFTGGLLYRPVGMAAK
jgi:hypothetical protein